ncbi:hypothetical protein SI65_00453 [Aspergillus cristatus]|uniref:HTH CENPB-type domain-containing protein n=1 Tax=Aspergillus cristatus TaxID=573508 RepID=A0A1E3BPG7_ASPCR|nr:hypothetical protein SI65_00453 [Aspergillus cristatus]
MIPEKEKAIEVALSEYKSGKHPSLRATAKAHNLPLSTLSDRNPDNSTDTRHTYHEKSQRLTPEEEDFLAEWILEQDRQGYPHTHIRARKMAQRIRQMHGDTEPIGFHWVSQFKKRHPEVSSSLGRRIKKSQKRAVPGPECHGALLG